MRTAFLSNVIQPKLSMIHGRNFVVPKCIKWPFHCNIIYAFAIQLLRIRFETCPCDPFTMRWKVPDFQSSGTQ